MELCLSTLMWPDQPIQESLAAAAPFEVRCLDLAAAAAHRHVPLSQGDEAIRELRESLEGWKVAALTADHPDLSRAPREGGAEAVAHTLGAVRAASALGARVVSISLGSTDIDAWETAWGRAVAALRQVLHQTARLPVRLAVKIHADDVLDSLKKARRLLVEIEDPRLGLTFDTAMLYYRRIDLREALDAAEGRLYHVHVRDATRSEFCLSVGRGEVRFGPVFRALREYGYDGALSIELLRTQERHGLAVEEALAESVPLLREALTTPARPSC
jgi:sugar phosphate isomerase/epimerase